MFKLRTISYYFNYNSSVAKITSIYLYLKVLTVTYIYRFIFVKSIDFSLTSQSMLWEIVQFYFYLASRLFFNAFTYFCILKSVQIEYMYFDSRWARIVSGGVGG